MGKRELTVFNHDIPHVTTCTRLRNNRMYFGSTECAEGDFPFESKLVGEHYAYVRSMIEEFQEQVFIKKEQLKLLRHIYDTIRQGKDFNYRSHENYTLRKQMKLLAYEIRDLKTDIANVKENLKKQMDAKDAYHTKLVAMRAAASEGNSTTASEE